MPETTPNPEPISLPPVPAPEVPEAPVAAPALEPVAAVEPAAGIVPEPAAAAAPADAASAAAVNEAQPEHGPAPAAAAVATDAAVDAAVAEPRAAPIPDLSPAACAAALAEHFPALFGAGRMLPIKLRIQADIQQRVPGRFSTKSLSIFLHRHTTSTGYIKALVNSPHRFDLDGQPAGEIAQEHKDAGVVELERRLAIVQARRVAEREAQRQARRPAAVAPTDGAPAAQGVPAQERPAHPPRPPRPDRPPRADRPPRGEAAPRGDRPPRPDRPDRPPRADRPPRPERAPDAQPAAVKPADSGAPMRAAPEAAAPPAPSVPLTPEQIADNEARRGRAALLRAFETTTLTRSNFCALKGLKDDVLEAQLVLAREERKLHPPPAAERDRDSDRPRADRPRFEDRGPRRDAPPRPGGQRGGRPPR